MADAGLASATEGGSSTEVEENCSPAKSSGRASYARSKSHHVAGTEQLERQPSGVQLRHSEPVLGQQKQQQAVPTADQQARGPAATVPLICACVAAGTGISYRSWPAKGSSAST